MDRAAIALLDSRDEIERRLRADQELVANRFCAREVAIAYGARSVITWAPDGLSFASESRDEQTARWAGFRAAADESDAAPIWMGTRQTEAGTFVAQFEVAEAA